MAPFLAFFAGKPIVVSSCPLGLPFFFITGGALIPATEMDPDAWSPVGV